MLDERLRPYATDRQWEYLVAYAEHGGYRTAGDALGVHESTVREAVRIVHKRAAQNGWAPAFDIVHELPEGLALKGTSIRYDGAGNVQQYWNKSRLQGLAQDELVEVPLHKIVKVSTLYDQQGRATQQWVATKPEDEQREALWQEAARAMASELPRVEAVTPPPACNDSLLACYPVGDHHLGMLAWDKETGADYDLKIGENLLIGATDYLVRSVPACGTALVAFLGDFMHYDSFETVTPTSRNMLDADGRYPKMVRAAIRSMRYLIEAAARRHHQVHVIVEIGNHDLSSSIFLMECLANVYENNPRITIDTSPAHYHYFEFGGCLIGTHHGHGAKMDSLPLIMATDRADAWGRSAHRYWWTGHVHHSKTKQVANAAQDFAGCSVESFRVLAPTDAWAAQKGYRSTRDMKAIVMHREHGEVARHTVNPAMVKESAA